MFGRFFGMAPAPQKPRVVTTAKRSKMSNIMKQINNTREKNDGPTKLIVAVIKKDIEEAKRLLDAGVDVNTKDRFGTPVLMLATRTISSNMPNSRKLDEKEAIYTKCIEMVKLLLEKGADVNKQDAYGLTPLYSIIVNKIIIRRYKPEFITILINNGADPTIPCKSGSTVLDYLYLPYKYEDHIDSFIDNNVVSRSTIKRALKEKNPLFITTEEEVQAKIDAAQRDTPDPDLKGLQIFSCWRDSDRIFLEGVIHRSPLTNAQKTQRKNAALRILKAKEEGTKVPPPSRVVGNAAESNIARIEGFGQVVKGYEKEINDNIEDAEINANAAEAEFEQEQKKAFPENAEVTKGIQNFQKEAAAELAAGTGAGKGGRRKSRRHRKTKKRTHKRSYRK